MGDKQGRKEENSEHRNGIRRSARLVLFEQQRPPHTGLVVGAAQTFGVALSMAWGAIRRTGPRFKTVLLDRVARPLCQTALQHTL